MDEKSDLYANKLHYVNYDRRHNLIRVCKVFFHGLFFSGASFGENFYGLKRVMTDGSTKLSSSAWRKSLIFLVSTCIFYLDFSACRFLQ